MDLLEVERLKLVVLKSKELLSVLSGECESGVISNLLNRTEQIINYFNKQNLTVTDITEKEKGIFKSVIKKVCLGYFFNKSQQGDLEYDFKEKIRDDIKKRCDNLILEDDIIFKYTLFSRQCNKYYPNPLEKALLNTLHSIIINEFTKQNEEFLINLK